MSQEIPQVFSISAQNVQQLQKMAELQDLIAVESEEDFEQYTETSPFAIYQRFKPLDELKTPHTKKSEEPSEVKEQKILSLEEAEQTASRFERNNEELKSKTLLILRSSITNDDSPLEILNKVLKVYPDQSIADEAFDFLIETTSGDLQTKIKDAKTELNQKYELEIKAGKNIGIQAREFSKEGLGSPTSLRDLYRNILANPREPLKLFEELTEKYPYSKLKLIVRFILHSLGADLKSKGPSVMPGELKSLMDQIRSMQGIFGVFRFFQSRMLLVQKQFLANQLLLPGRINFEFLGKIFIKLIAEKYINTDKVLQFAKLLGLSEETIAQMIIFTQFRDAVKQVSPKYYRNQKHQDDLGHAIMDALEELEDELEEEEEEEK